MLEPHFNRQWITEIWLKSWIILLNYNAKIRTAYSSTIVHNYGSMLTIDYLWILEILYNNVHFNYVDVKMAAVYSRKDLWEKYLFPVFIYNIITVDFYQLWLNFNVTSTKNIDVISTTLFRRIFDVASTKNIDVISTTLFRRLIDVVLRVMTSWRHSNVYSTSYRRHVPTGILPYSKNSLSRGTPACHASALQYKQSLPGEHPLSAH